jgi:hypothetical protein
VAGAVAATTLAGVVAGTGTVSAEIQGCLAGPVSGIAATRNGGAYGWSAS